MKLGIVTMLALAACVGFVMACALFEQTPVCPKSRPNCAEFPPDPPAQVARDAGGDAP